MPLVRSQQNLVVLANFAVWYVYYNEIVLHKKWTHFMNNSSFWTKNVKSPQQQNKTANIKILVRAGNGIWDPWHCSLMCTSSQAI